MVAAALTKLTACLRVEGDSKGGAGPGGDGSGPPGATGLGTGGLSAPGGAGAGGAFAMPGPYPHPSSYYEPSGPAPGGAAAPGGALTARSRSLSGAGAPAPSGGLYAGMLGGSGMAPGGAGAGSDTSRILDTVLNIIMTINDGALSTSLAGAGPQTPGYPLSPTASRGTPMVSRVNSFGHNELSPLSDHGPSISLGPGIGSGSGVDVGGRAPLVSSVSTLSDPAAVLCSLAIRTLSEVRAPRLFFVFSAKCDGRPRCPPPPDELVTPPHPHRSSPIQRTYITHAQHPFPSALSTTAATRHPSPHSP